MIVGSFELLNRYEVIVANYCHITVNYYNNYAIILLLHDSEVLTRRGSGKITRFTLLEKRCYCNTFRGACSDVYI